MTDRHNERSSKANNADLLDAFKAPFSERETTVDAQQHGLILFSFGRNGGFAKAGDKSNEGVSVA